MKKMHEDECGLLVYQRILVAIDELRTAPARARCPCDRCGVELRGETHPPDWLVFFERVVESVNETPE
jgi:hypothetical protein